jgi:hypothetical protein
MRPVSAMNDSLPYVEILRRLCAEWRTHKPAPRYRTRGYLPNGTARATLYLGSYALRL